MAGTRKSRKKATPRGDLFMEGTPTRDIEAALKAECRSTKAAFVLLACLKRRDGMSGPAIAKDLKRPTNTVFDWLSKMHKHGLEARYDKPKSGRPRIIRPDKHKEISDMVDKQPRGCEMKSGVWTGRLLLIMITDLLKMHNISRSTIYRTMHRMNKSYRKPGRPFDHRTPPDSIKEEFKTDLAQNIGKMAAAGFRIFWVDEAHFTTKTKRGMTWLAKGIRTAHKIEPFGKSCTCFGALGDGDLFYHQYYDRGNTGNMIAFVQSLYEKYGKVLLIMDNASYHKSKELMEHIKGYGGDVEIIYQPPYSPDLNPVEMVWKELKKYIANGRYKKVDDLTDVMDDMIRDGDNAHHTRIRAGCHRTVLGRGTATHRNTPVCTIIQRYVGVSSIRRLYIWTPTHVSCLYCHIRAAACRSDSPRMPRYRRGGHRQLPVTYGKHYSDDCALDV
ncbi:MAG: IS630 family transposase [Candidatus Omnitrophica bacterium]|nr:IS630 family transposase [Candidatus Omnitrophota bacterium]